jgi:hypothetical protein
MIAVSGGIGGSLPDPGGFVPEGVGVRSFGVVYTVSVGINGVVPPPPFGVVPPPPFGVVPPPPFGVVRPPLLGVVPPPPFGVVPPPLLGVVRTPPFGVVPGVGSDTRFPVFGGVGGILGVVGGVVGFLVVGRVYTVSVGINGVVPPPPFGVVPPPDPVVPGGVELISPCV